MVAGIAALILSIRPDLTLTDVKEILRDSADKIGPESGYTGNPGHSVAFGYRKVNAGEAVKAALKIP